MAKRKRKAGDVAEIAFSYKANKDSESKTHVLLPFGVDDMPDMISVEFVQEAILRGAPILLQEMGRNGELEAFFEQHGVNAQFSYDVPVTRDVIQVGNMTISRKELEARVKTLTPEQIAALGF